MEVRKWSWRFKFSEISEDDSQIFRRTLRISGLEVADGAKLDVPTTDRQNEKKTKKHRPFYEAVDAHARRRLINTWEMTKKTVFLVISQVFIINTVQDELNWLHLAVIGSVKMEVTSLVTQCFKPLWFHHFMEFAHLLPFIYM